MLIYAKEILQYALSGRKTNTAHHPEYNIYRRATMHL